MKVKSQARLRPKLERRSVTHLRLAVTLLSNNLLAEELDTGGIEPEAYSAELLADYEEAIGTMGLPPDDATYRHYGYNRYWKLFEIRKDNFGELVVSEKRIPPRLTPAENIDTVAETLRDMELLKNGQSRAETERKVNPVYRA